VPALVASTKQMHYTKPFKKILKSKKWRKTRLNMHIDLVLKDGGVLHNNIKIISGN